LTPDFLDLFPASQGTVRRSPCVPALRQTSLLSGLAMRSGSARPGRTKQHAQDGYLDDGIVDTRPLWVQSRLLRSFSWFRAKQWGFSNRRGWDHHEQRHPYLPRSSQGRTLISRGSIARDKEIVSTRPTRSCRLELQYPTVLTASCVHRPIILRAEDRPKSLPKPCT
jgi:hypothetical protein